MNEISAKIREVSTENWHAMTVSEVLERLESNPDGLSTSEAQTRLTEHGKNVLPEARRPSPIAIFSASFEARSFTFCSSQPHFPLLLIIL